MSVAINANFFPLRMSLRRREPVQLKVEVANRGNNSKMLSLGVVVARSLSLDKGGLKSSASERVEALLPGERKTIYFDVFPKPQFADIGEYPVEITVKEYGRNYSDIVEEYEKLMDLKVEK